MEGGRLVPGWKGGLDAARVRAADELRHLPAAMRRLDTDLGPYPVMISEGLQTLRDTLASQV
jgi:hypothetical protein